MHFLTYRLIILYALMTLTLSVFAVELNIRDFGAKCDGKTDDVIAVQKAVDACPDGGTIIIPGMTAIGNPGVLILGKRDVTIKGVNGGGFRSLAVTDLGTGIGVCAMLLRHCTNCTIQDLEFDGNNIPVSVLGFSQCVSCKAERLNIHDVAMGDKVCAAMVSAGSRHNQYLNITINRTGTNNANGTRGMWLGNWWESANEWYPIVKGCHISNAGGTGIATHAIGAVITDNICENGIGGGIKLVPPPPATSKATSYVERNQCRGWTFHGIQIDLGHDIVVRDNILEDNAMAGIYIISVMGTENGADQPAQRITITGNLIRNNRSGNMYGGIMAHGGEDFEISNNTFIDTRTSDDRTQISGITFLAMNQEYKNIVVSGNRFINHKQNGITLWPNKYNFTNLRITGNIFDGNTDNGIYFDPKVNMKEVFIVGNTFIKNGKEATEPLADKIPATTLPAPSQLDESAVPKVSWAAVKDATSYTVQIATDEGLTNNLVTYSGITGPDYILPNLKPGDIYYWRVMAVIENAPGAWSEIRSLR